uniref:Uncharacterized protein n=1 Tax=Anopheles dirus TaxID=7168 RepID=A0A182NAV0_9DIPT
MLLPDQTYEQANLRQERLRRPSAAYDAGGGFPRGLFALRQLDVKRLQRGLQRSGATPGLYVDGVAGVGEELAGVLANNEMKFGMRACVEEGSGSSSGVGSSGEVGCASRDGKHPQPELEVRLTRSLTNGGSKQHPLGREDPTAALYHDAESLWSGRAASTTRADERDRSATIDGRCRSGSRQRAPPVELKDQPSRSEQTDRGIGLDSISSPGSSLSYSSDSSDGEEFTARPRRTCRSRMAGAVDTVKEATPDAPDAPADAHDPGERDDYDKTSDFFNNIPEFQGEALGPFSIESKGNEPDWGSIRTNVDVLRACELFLMRHRMRPDFFCKYKTAMNPSASAPASFPLSRTSRTPVDVRKPKSVSPPMQRPASRAQDVGFSRASAERPAGPIYSVPNRAGKKRRPNA